MIIVDDHLALLSLAGLDVVEDRDDDIVTTSLWYLRLVSAVTAPVVDGQGLGRLARVLSALPDPAAARDQILRPRAELIVVLHPMEFSVETARMQRQERLNLLAAETLGAAAHFDASILVAPPNAGGPIERAARAQHIDYGILTT